MDDPQVPKRLDEAITMVGTCMDMCPRFERYRRERENNLFNWEVVRIFSYNRQLRNLRCSFLEDSRDEARRSQTRSENV
jgi:hypothetical protein